MSEVNEGDQTNMWLPPRPAGSKPSKPRDPAEPTSEPESASARAFAEGWPANPGWVPEGASSWSHGQQTRDPGTNPSATSTPPLGNTWPPAGGSWPNAASYQHAGSPSGPQPVWIPAQSPSYPTAPDGFRPGPTDVPSAPYPGPPPPISRPNTGRVVAAVVGVVVLVAAGVTAGVVLSGRGSDSPGPIASAPAGSTGTDGAGTTGGGDQGSAGGASGSGSNSGSGGTGSGGTSTSPQTGAGTDLPPGTGQLDLTTLTLGGSVTGADAADIALTLDAYFTGINSGDYSSAWNQLSPNQQAKNPLGAFSAATSGTIDHDVRLAAATPTSDGTARASVTFTSTQPGDKGVNPGETCTDWSITYVLVRGSGAGGWVISDTPSAQHSAC